MKILELEWERGRWHLLWQEAVLGGQLWQCLGYEPKENLNKARPENITNLATSSCEMPKATNLSYQLCHSLGMWSSQCYMNLLIMSWLPYGQQDPHMLGVPVICTLDMLTVPST